MRCLFFCVQFKKSGKEPKAGAELVFGNTTYKTKVRLMIKKTTNKHALTMSAWTATNECFHHIVLFNVLFFD